MKSPAAHRPFGALRPRRRLLAVLAAVTAVAASLLTPFAPAANADPRVSVTSISPTVSLASVYSPSMHRWIRSHVLHPPGAPAGLPTFYMLPGAGGAEDGISWYNNTPIKRFFATRRVNVVLPIGGRFSMMSDWQRPDPALGVNKWETFFTRELPAAVNQHFRTNGVNALSGVSMSAGPALTLAERSGRLFRAVAAYSGCPGATDPLGLAAATAIPARGGGNVLNMWGPPGSADWVRHDPIINAGRLRGKTIFLSAGSGLPGPVDGDPLRNGFGLVGGNAMEAIALQCTSAMSRRLNGLGIPHRFIHRPDGVHTWGLFYADFRASWPMIARAIGV
ncbi:alpha/beta hydrolase [Gordonia shandongensis]|uniref:alpha/beta hydrolase n=1 Tax=Gordonia shandongensis TaxID=376351 RepID=UPI001FE23718|nr:alpha/beta hydrolase family protein [Gordonia shandongensis]